jgi:AcrR family transcriptional regulator
VSYAGSFDRFYGSLDGVAIFLFWLYLSGWVVILLYNQFASKEDIFREMLLRVSGQLEHAFPPGIETQGDVQDVLRLVARMILKLHKNPEYLGFLRMVVADSRQFPWIAEEFAAVMEPQTERLVRYLAHVTAMGILDRQNPLLAAHQLMGMLNECRLRDRLFPVRYRRRAHARVLSRDGQIRGVQIGIR